MPPRKKISAPAARIYKAIEPLHQAKFPSQKKRIKSYGKKAPLRKLPMQDNTLTQMGFEVDRPFEDEQDIEAIEPEIPAPVINAAKLKKKRRKTTGDELDEDEDVYMDESEKRKKRRRKTAGDEGDEVRKAEKRKKTRWRNTMVDTPTSVYTQTLTQMPSWTSTAHEVEEDGSIFGIPDTSFQVLVPHRRTLSRTSKSSPNHPNDTALEKENVPGNMGPPQTPHRKSMHEIPSSQSPGTPLSSHTRSRTRPTPLRERPACTPIPFSLPSKSKPPNLPSLPRLEIQVTFGTEETQLSRILTTPAKGSSPAKSVKFAIPVTSDDEEEEEAGSSPLMNNEPSADQAGTCQGPSTELDTGLEIPDSDAESDADEKEEEEEEEELGAETCYDDPGFETLVEADRLVLSLEATHFDESQDLGEVPTRDLGEEPRRSNFMESQRISTQHVTAMAPQSRNSDIFISIHPRHVKNIVGRKKDHEFRSWPLAHTVVRIWIYETAQVSTIRYMAAIGPAKRPGAILNENGIRNAEFNAKPTNSGEFAYEILNLYELADPLTLAELKEKAWLKAAPQKFQWVKPAVLGELVANLLPPIFTSAEIASVSQPLSSTDTQEAAAQLFDTLVQFTQLEPPAAEQPPSEVIPSSQSIEQKKTYNEHPTLTQETQHIPPRSSQAETVDLSQSQTPRHQTQAEIVWESPTRPVPSNSPGLPTPHEARFHKADDVAPFSLASSQLLTKSQLLPDSLINDSIPGPPLFIDDSDEEN